MNTPKLRFKEFSAPWTKEKFNFLFQEVNLRNGDTEQYPLYSLTVQDGVTEKSDRYNREFLVKKGDNYKLVHPGEFVSNPMNMTIGALAQYHGNKPISVSGYYNVFKNISQFGNQFLEDYLKSPKLISLYKSIATGSLIEKQRVHFSQFINLSADLPSPEEANKISNFFELLYIKIQLQQEKIDLLKQQKKGFMQKIFSKELRFKDDNGQEFPEWTSKVEASQLFTSVSDKNHNGEYPVLAATQDKGIVARDSLDRHMSANEDNYSNYKLIKSNDFVISLRSFQGGIELSELTGLVSPAYTVFRKKSKLVHELYFSKLFKTESFISQLNSTTYGIRDGKAISYKDFSTMKFSIPCLEEQIKIASFLEVFDKRIQAENIKLSCLTQQKQAFMQQMFI